jgi:glycosyltransferase involved in cell wall biosynthesis
VNRTPAAANLAPLHRPASSLPRVVMHAPSSTGGHPLYVQELLTALVRHPQGGERFELMTSVDLEPQFRTDAYPINDVLPILRHKREFPNKLAWAWNRLTYYNGRDRMFLDWCAARPEVRGVHLQEFSISMRRMVRSLRRMGKSVFYTVHNIRPHAYPHFVPPALWDRLNRDACNACDRLIVHTERLREDLSTFLGKGHPPIDVAPHGVWSGNGAAGQEPPSVAERMASKRLLFFGTIRRNKGLDVLLDAAESLRDFTITIAGEAREGEYFRTVVRPRVEQLRAKGVSIELIDRFIPESEVAGIFNCHSVLLLPYTSEFTAQSGVVFLALAHAIPVVASEAGGMRDLFAEHRIGTTFAEHTSAAFAAAVRKCFDASQVSPAELSANLAAARERFSWRSAAEATLASYAAGFMSRSEERESRRRGVSRGGQLSSYAPDVKGETTNDRGFATIAAQQHGG